MAIPASCLVLDIATTCGWVVYHRGAVVSGSTCFALRSGEGPGMRYVRFRKEFLNKFLRMKHVFFEEVHNHKGMDAAHIYGGLVATLQAWCEENSIPYTGVGVNVWKKGFLGKGKGNASKEVVSLAVHQLGYNPKDNDESDALAIFEYLKKKHRL